MREALLDVLASSLITSSFHCSLYSLSCFWCRSRPHNSSSSSSSSSSPLSLFKCFGDFLGVAGRSTALEEEHVLLRLLALLALADDKDAFSNLNESVLFLLGCLHTMFGNLSGLGLLLNAYISELSLVIDCLGLNNVLSSSGPDDTVITGKPATLFTFGVLFQLFDLLRSSLYVFICKLWFI